MRENLDQERGCSGKLWIKSTSRPSLGDLGTAVEVECAAWKGRGGGEGQKAQATRSRPPRDRVASAKPQPRRSRARPLHLRPLHLHHALARLRPHAICIVTIHRSLAFSTNLGESPLAIRFAALAPGSADAPRPVPSSPFYTSHPPRPDLHLAQHLAALPSPSAVDFCHPELLDAHRQAIFRQSYPPNVRALRGSLWSKGWGLQGLRSPAVRSRSARHFPGRMGVESLWRRREESRLLSAETLRKPGRVGFALRRKTRARDFFFFFLTVHLMCVSVSQR